MLLTLSLFSCHPSFTFSLVVFKYMDIPSLDIRPERAEDRPQIRGLEVKLFGPGRFARTAYRVRETAREPERFCFVAFEGERLVGSIRFTSVSIGGRGGALLLGPLVVDFDRKDRGIGSALIEAGIRAAQQSDYALVILVGDLPYYGKRGFQLVPPGQILMPGPVDLKRLLAHELKDGALAEYSGLVAGL